MDICDREILLNCSELGEELQEYFGPINRKYFATDIKTLSMTENMKKVHKEDSDEELRKFLSAASWAAPDGQVIKSYEGLGFIIDTHSRPFGFEDNFPAKDLVKRLEKLFSKDDAIKQEFIVEILNFNLTSMRTSAEESMEALDKINEIDPDEHPAVKLTVAAAFAREAHRQDHKTLEDVFAEANERERDELVSIYKTLNQPNDNIKVLTSADGLGRIAIVGNDIDIAVDKLITANIAINKTSDVSLYSDALALRGRKSKDELKGSIERTVRIFDKYNPYRVSKKKRLRL